MTIVGATGNLVQGICHRISHPHGDDASRSEAVGWLAGNAGDISAWQVIRALLATGSGPDLVADASGRWLCQHGLQLEAQFVFKSWLDAGGALEHVKIQVLDWLALHSAAPEARFVYQSWLDAGGAIGSVEEHLLGWIERYALLSEARFVCRSWLNAGGTPSSIEGPVLRWLERHAVTPDADFLLYAWLGRGGAFEVVKQYACAWFHEYCHEERASFLAKQLSVIKPLPEMTIRDIARWVSRFPAHEDALFRISRISPVLSARVSISVETRAVIMAAAHKAIDAFFLTVPRMWGGNPNATRKAMGILIQNLCRSSTFDPRFDRRTLEIVSLAVSSGDVFRPRQNLFVAPELLDVVSEALSVGTLDYVSDCIGIELVGASLLDDRAVGSRSILTALVSLERNHPHPLWRQCLRRLRESRRNAWRRGPVSSTATQLEATTDMMCTEPSGPRLPDVTVPDIGKTVH